MERRCDLCEWWEDLGYDENVGMRDGFCFRFPPTRLLNDENDLEERVRTAYIEYCGEFTPKGEPLPATKQLQSEIESLKVRLTILEIMMAQEEFGKE